MQAGSRQLFVFNTHLQASHSGGGSGGGSGGAAEDARVRDAQLQRVRECITRVTRHAGAPWLLGGDFNVDAIADATVADIAWHSMAWHGMAWHNT